jgi:hypothetical protein
VARGIELDWVVIRINTIRRIVALSVTILVASAVLVFAYLRLNPSPDVAARRAIAAAQEAQDRAQRNGLAEKYASEFEQSRNLLVTAQDAYGSERFEEARDSAGMALVRFEAMIGSGSRTVRGVGQFFTIDGAVSVQRAGQSEWERASVNMPVFNGDFVRTGREGAAEVLFIDDVLFKIAPGSLLEIYHRVDAGDEAGAVKMVVGRVNVVTASSPSSVATDSIRTEIGTDSLVAVGVSGEDDRTVVAAYGGTAQLSNAQGQRIRLAEREQITGTAENGFATKSRLPDPPIPTEPLNNTGFDMRTDRVINLRWTRPSEAVATRLQVSRAKSFSQADLDINSDDLRGESARLQPLAPGTYFWRVASVIDDDLVSEWSSARLFRIDSGDRQRVIRDLEPPTLDVPKAQRLGHLFIVEGTTEVGASVSVNGRAVEVDRDGRFRRTVEFRRLGMNEIVVKAVDPAGNQTERRQKVYLEEF